MFSSVFGRHYLKNGLVFNQLIFRAVLVSGSDFEKWIGACLPVFGIAPAALRDRLNKRAALRSVFPRFLAYKTIHSLTFVSVCKRNTITKCPPE